ncbi:hypothetical protein [Paragemmobacter straminiformis]|uniref:Uncharacterized protein n=1 Tax=Paragemmobacter straminiformis TaxID=2045119 RepID=A0A842IEE2_9RHOB|nr:hypothetical protein [Gemmobacter straminiformis]MBC2837507.1 hypothetical protein [Gemmobacter straminiformis]
MTPQDIASALQAAGFVGIEPVGDTVYARGDGPAAPEFTAHAGAGGTTLTLRFEVRAPEAALADWRISQKGTLAIVRGETHLTLTVTQAGLAAALPQWRKLMQTAAKQAVAWRRGQKPLHGM